MTELVLPPLTLPQPGILGREGRHTWNDAVTMGNYSADPPDPHAYLISTPGLHSLPDPEDLRDNATGRSGEIARNSVRRGKTTVYNGEVRARSFASMRSLWTLIAGEFKEMAEGRMLVTPTPSGVGVSRYYRARCLTADPGDEVLIEDANWPYTLPFAIALRLGDARFYDPVAVEGDTAPAGAGSVTLTHEGTAPSDPLITLYGPLPAAVTVTNVTTGKALVLTGLSIAGGETVEIDFASRRITKNGTDDYGAKRDRLLSPWWHLDEPGISPGGDTEIAISGTGLASPAYAHVAFSPAYVA